MTRTLMPEFEAALLALDQLSAHRILADAARGQPSERVVEDILVPALDAYLKLAVFLAPVCAAVVSNAKSVEEVEAARASLALSNTALEEANKKLAEAAEELRDVQEILPICAWCNRILDEEGVWSRLATYLADHTGSQFSHGICIECADDALGHAAKDAPAPEPAVEDPHDAPRPLRPIPEGTGARY